MTRKTYLAWLLVWTCFMGWSEIVSAQPLENLIETQSTAATEAIRSQDTIDTLADETQRLLSIYRSTVRQTESLQVYVEQLDRLLDSQQKEAASLETQLQEIEVTQRDIVPLLVRMLEHLVQFVALDIPFLPEERQERLIRLRNTFDQSDLTITEKYRSIMEAYQIEADYGRTIEAYRGAVTIDGRERTVDFFRVGRLALLYQSLDGQEVGHWNRETQEWEVLPNSYQRSIKRGLQIAAKQSVPNLLLLPVPAPSEATP